MNFEQYIPLAVSTESVKPFQGLHGHRVSRLMHASLGIITELNELEEHTNSTNLIEEIGDVMWYLAVICHAFSIRPRPIPSNRDLANSAAACLCDISKRAYFYGIGVPDEKLPQILTYVESIMGHLERISGNRLDQAMTTNIAKLRKRYPDKFSEERAVNRDLRVEQAALESEL